MTSPQTNQVPHGFEIGIAEIDWQHGQLHSLLERLKHSIEMGYGLAANTILTELIIQTRIHFAVEESLMQLLSYPETEAHVAEHRRLAEQLEKLKRRAQDFDVGDGLATFIETWLFDHIDHFDREFVGHFLARGINCQGSPATRKQSD